MNLFLTQTDSITGTSMTTKFAHEAEEQFATILNFYKLEWLYEPTMFVIRRNEDGDVVRGFTPDFYIPEYDTYVEITVMQKVSKKRRKINNTLEKYPNLNIILINRQDMADLLMKYKFLFC